MGPAYDSVDVELFGLDAFTHATDQRSVGELLFDVDRQARILLMDVTQHDAGPLLHAWPDLVREANNMWHAMPIPQPASITTTYSANCMDRLDAISDAIRQRLVVKRWPGPADPDRRLAEMTRTLSRAADLTRRFAPHGPNTAAGRDDLESARGRLIHATYLATHAVSVALLEFGRTLRDDAATTPRPLTAPGADIPYAVAPTTEWLRRIGAAETSLARVASRRQIAPLLNAEHSAPPRPGRLEQALARWDLEAHRGLAGAAWRHNIVLVTRTQAFIAGTTLTLLDAARAAETVDVPTRLLTTIARSGTAWSDLASRWDDLTPAQSHPTNSLMLAAGELRAAARELTHQGATRAAARAIATRPGAVAGLRAALAALSHAAELAHITDERSTTTGLTGQARPMSVRIHNDIEAGRVLTATDADAAWISPNDIRDQHIVPAPVPLLAALESSSHAAVQAATAAAACAVPTSHLPDHTLAGTTDVDKPHEHHRTANPDLRQLRAPRSSSPPPSRT